MTAALARAGLALALLAGSLAPAAAAHHLSVGASDTALEPGEAPDEPSVPEPWYRTGLGRGCEGYDPEASVEREPDQLANATRREGFCGQLVYNPDSPAFRQASPPDQVLTSLVGTFDAVFATYVGTHQFATCLPFCAGPASPLVEAGHRAVYQASCPTRLTPCQPPEGGRTHEFAVNLAVPNPTEQADLGPMNGWLYPVYDQTIVAFLEDPDGDPIDARALEGLVEADRSGLPPDAVPRVCGFTPDADVRPMATPSSFCEVEFRWIGETDDGQAWEAGRPGSPCRSPAYVCGASQPHWQAEVTCAMALANCGGPASSAGNADDVLGESEAGDGAQSERCEGRCRREDGGRRAQSSDPPAEADSTARYLRWHFVAAPSLSSCNGAREPGFGVDTGTRWPFLAHDLDVYSPATGQVLDSTLPNVRTWGDTWRDELAATGEDRVPEPNRLGGSPAEEERRKVAKTWTTEPNAPGDTSKRHVEVPRTNACNELGGAVESGPRLDPWVNVVDSRVTASNLETGTDLYRNEAEDQSAGNRPGPGLYNTRGMVGVFTDPDDDGDYEQAANPRVFSGVADVGAYPMFWDLRLDAAGQPAPEEACRMGGRSLTTLMDEAGYGPRTGLLQVVYLHEGADWYYRADAASLPWEGIVGLNDADGDDDAHPQHNAHLFMSQGLWRQLRSGDSAVWNALQGALDRLPDPPEEVEVVRSTDMLAPQGGLRSDFFDQCPEPTGGFESKWSFTHDCLEGPLRDDCGRDTVVTAYVRDVQGNVGGPGIPAFQPFAEGAYAFRPGVETWYDVDPLDNDPDRNDRDGSPPTGEG